MVEIITDLIPLTTVHTTSSGKKIYIRSGKKIKPLTLTIHSTANLKSTAMNERNWLVSSNNKSDASWNVCVDEKEAVIAIPLTEKSNHAGSAEGNLTSIGLEICESGDREKTLRNAIYVSAHILKDFGLSYKDLRQHHDWNGKNCPRILRDTNRWDWFVNEVRKEMEANNVLENLIDKYGSAEVENALEQLIKAINDDGKPAPWAKKEFEEAVKLGITDGSRPEMYATRQEVAIMIERAIELEKE